MGLWTIRNSDSKPIRIYMTKGFVCPRCKKPVKVKSASNHFREQTWIDYTSECNNNTCIVDRLYWTVAEEKKLGVPCH